MDLFFSSPCGAAGTLLLRCLAKDPKQRLRDIGEARIAIDTIDDVLPEDAVVPGSRPAFAKPTWLLPWFAVAVLVTGVVVWEARRQASTPGNPLADPQFSHFTDWEGTEGAAEISPDGRFVKIPFQPWAEALFLERFSRNGAGAPSERCLTTGVPEARWEGDTFVVDTTGFNDRTWLDKAGHPHTEQLHTTERFQRPNVGRLELEVTIDDRKAYTRPWTATIPFRSQILTSLKMRARTSRTQRESRPRSIEIAHGLGYKKCWLSP